MSHNTTSWKSHSSTWRWTAGNDGHAPEGGNARRVGGYPALARQKAIGQHDQREMARQAIPASALVVGQAALAFGVLVELLDGPATVRQFDQPLQRRIRRQVAEIPLHFTAFARHRALAEQPALRPGHHARMAGGELRPTRRPVHAYGSKVFAEDGALVFTPRDGLPVVGWQGLQHGLGWVQRRGARLLGLTPPARVQRRHVRGRPHLGWPPDPKGA